MASISDDAVGTAAKNDLLAIKILEYRLKRGQGKEPNFKKQMRDKLRLLGGFLLRARKDIPGCHSLTEILRPQHFHQITSVIQAMGDENNANSLPTKLGYMLKPGVRLLRGEAMLDDPPTR